MSHNRRSNSQSPKNNSKEKTKKVKRSPSVSLDKNSELDKLSQFYKENPELQEPISIHSELAQSLFNQTSKPRANSPDPLFNKLPSANFSVDSLLSVDSIAFSDTVQSPDIFSGITQDTRKMAAFSLSDFHKAVPEFFGDVKQTEKFLGCCDYYFNRLHDDEKTSVMGYISTKLSGAAYAFYREHSTETWPIFRESLKGHFSRIKRQS